MQYNVNPGLINPKRLFHWEATIKKYQMEWLLEEYPLIFINHDLLIWCWHYIMVFYDINVGKTMPLTIPQSSPFL